MKKRFFLILATVFIMLFIAGSCSKPICPDPQPIENNMLTIIPDADEPYAFISSFAPNDPRPNEPSIEAMAWTISGNPIVLRSLLDFDFSALPSDAIVEKATLILFSDTTGQQNLTPHKGHSTLSGSNSWILQRITSSWDESTVTWNTAPSTDIPNQLVLPSSSTDYQSYIIDVTEFIKDELNSPSSYHGFMFRLSNESSYRAIQFCSPNSNFPALRPQLKIEYK